MRTIYKYQLNDADNIIEMPANSMVLSAATQNHEVVIWASVETTHEINNRRFLVIGTGWDMSEYDSLELKFINTVFVDRMVFHVFEVI